MSNASLKCDYELFKVIKNYCSKKGIKLKFFTEEALREKLEKADNIK